MGARTRTCARSCEEHTSRERILKDTLLSAQKVAEDVKAERAQEAELIVKDAELLSERLIGQAMSRVRTWSGRSRTSRWSARPRANR